MEEGVGRIDTLQAIELAEGVEVRLRIAGPLPRGLALGLDLLIQAGVLTIVGIIIAIAGMAIGWEVAGGVIMLLWFFMSWWFPVFFEAGKRGATPGKMVMGLRVVQTSGAPITFGQAVVRNFLRVVDCLPVVPVMSLTARCTYTFIWSRDFCIHCTQRVCSSSRFSRWRCSARIRTTASPGRKEPRSSPQLCRCWIH